MDTRQTLHLRSHCARFLPFLLRMHAPFCPTVRAPCSCSTTVLLAFTADWLDTPSMCALRSLSAQPQLCSADVLSLATIRLRVPYIPLLLLLTRKDLLLPASVADLWLILSSSPPCSSQHESGPLLQLSLLAPSPHIHHPRPAPFPTHHVLPSCISAPTHEACLQFL